MPNEQSSPCPAINTTPTSPPPLTSPPETHFFTIPDITVPIPVSSSSPVTSTPPSNPVSLSCVANPTSPPYSEQTKSVTPQASKVSEEDPDQYLNSSVLDSVAPTESPEKEAAQNIMAIAVESLMNEGASPLPEIQGEETPFLGVERTLVLFESPVHDTVTEKPVEEPDSLSAKTNQEGEVVADKHILVVEVDKDAVEEPSSLVKRSTKVQKFVVENDLFEGDIVAVASRNRKFVEMSRKQKWETVGEPGLMKTIPSDSGLGQESLRTQKSLVRSHV
ncbi:PREDICTED: uncharacterized protein LOC109224319 [Nicotiana attenuata]|uniref:uncharacterized protein LOC109224319 n=1 Tax=Nicotiana attenuata TaxID=49451 RepID=UPI000905CC0F|nr:PREDICTED: uncharacterized protein LOC109224319 [Nicotiana attenuata]